MDAIYVEDRSECEFVSIRGKTWVKRNAADASFRLSSIQVKPNTTYTWSMTVYSDTDTTLQFIHYDGSGYSSQAGVTVGTTPRRIVKTFTTRASSSYEILHIYVVGNISHYFSDFQLEEMPFATSFVDGAREDGKLIYPTNVSGDFTCSFWCKFNYEWYNNLSGHNKKMIRFNSSIDVGHITWTDWSSSLGSSLPFLDLEPNTYWDGVQHHWHDAFQYSADKWYYITFIKSGNSMRQIVYDDLAEKYNDRVFTYTDSSKFANFSFDQIVFFGEWCTLIDELRIDDIARTDEEIYAWYVSSAPHFPPDRIKAIG